MLIFSIVWVVLATTVTVIATTRRTAVRQDDGASPTEFPADAVEETGSRGKALTGFAVVYTLALLAGFVYISWQHGQELIK